MEICLQLQYCMAYVNYLLVGLKRQTWSQIYGAICDGFSRLDKSLEDSP